MTQFHWKIRIYRENGDYWICQVNTNPDLREIALLQEFYTRLTGCSILLEGMSQERYKEIEGLGTAFSKLWPGVRR